MRKWGSERCTDPAKAPRPDQCPPPPSPPSCHPADFRPLSSSFLSYPSSLQASPSPPACLRAHFSICPRLSLYCHLYLMPQSLFNYVFLFFPSIFAFLGLSILRPPPPFSLSVPSLSPLPCPLPSP